MANGYTEHLNRIVSGNGLEPRIFLPRRGDLLIWHGALIHGGTAMLNPELTRRSFICHYTSMASHKQAQRFRVGSGYCFDQPPSAAYQPSRLRRLASGVARGLGIRST
jgi:phytanoyl-CoA hydroxylase